MKLAVLAGGSGSRMGFVEKPLMRVCGKRIIERIAGLGFPMLIVCGEKRDVYERIAKDFADVEVVEDLVKGFGPLGGIYTALHFSRDVVVVGGDMPFVRRDVVTLLFERGRKMGCNALIPEWSDGKKEPLLAYYSSSALPAFREAIERGERKIMRAVDRMERTSFLQVDEIRRVDGDLVSFFNVNTPEDLKRAEEICSSTDTEGE